MTSAARLATVLLVVFALLALPQTARAKTIKVGNGTPASCTEAALRNALTFAGGEKSSVIQFQCGPAPIAITVTATLTVPDNTTINGNGLITLDGQFAVGTILHVGLSSAVTLQNLNISRGGFLSPAGDGGGVLNEGTLTIRGSTFRRNVSNGAGAGAIFGGRTLEIHESVFEHNSGGFGIGAIVGGAITIYGSTFSNNGGEAVGAINGGTVFVSRSTFSNNITRIGAGGIEAGTLTVSDSTLSGNSSVDAGGAIHAGLVTINDSVFSGNHGGLDGGGALAIQGGTISNSIITQNGTFTVGGGILKEGKGTLTIRDSTITQNTAGFDGGGIYTLAGGTAPELVNTIVTNNTPDDIAP